MKSEQMTLMAFTDGAAAEGTLNLNGDVLYGTAEAIQIPKGLALKIWSKHINGAAVTVNTEFTQDIGAESPEWTIFSKDVFAASVEGDRNIEKRRPLLFRGLTGNEAVRFTYDQAAAGVSGFEINVEFCAIQ